MEQFGRYGCIILAIVFISTNVNINNALPTNDHQNSSEINLPPLVFPEKNATTGSLPPLVFPEDKASTGSLPPLIFPKMKTTVLPPAIFPTDNATRVGDLEKLSANKTTKAPQSTPQSAPPLLFPTKNGSVPVLNVPMVFPEDRKLFNIIPIVNETILEILNNNGTLDRIPSASDYYDEDSSEESESKDTSESSEEVEEVEPVDKKKQSDELEENYKGKAALMSANDVEDDTEVDHPILKHSHILGIIAATLAALCACIYIGLTVWRRMIFNRYGMRERLINEDDFFNNKSITRDF